MWHNSRRAFKFIYFVALTLVTITSAGDPAPSSVLQQPSNPLQVCLYDGCIQGKSEPGNFRSFDAFYGIPFATPPLGNLRFKSPIPPPHWDFLWDATFPRSACMQQDMVTKQITGKEDCLYLNVFRPKSGNRKKSLPVIVFIHGGSFKLGSSDPALFGPDYFMDTQEVIVVTIQYRLGVFGFLAANDISCKGNFGLKDQNMALQWVRGNIRAFGGNPNEVTVMGQSAGAASVQYQMISKRSDGLFQKGILMSGAAFAFWAVEKNPEPVFRKFAEIAGVPQAQTENPAKIVELLRQKTALELMEYHESIPVLHTVISVFRPVVEGKWRGAFIDKDPERIWASGHYEQRPFLTGTTGYEQGSFDDMYHNATVRQLLLSNPEAGIAAALGYPQAVLGPMIQFYFNGQITEENFINILRLRDLFLDYPMYKTVDYYMRYANEKRRPVDLYHFNFTAPFSLSFLTNPFPIGEKGASHMDDLLYLFRFKIFDSVFVRGAPENEMKDFFVRYIVDYVKEGVADSYGVRSCSSRQMERRFCEYLDIQRDYSVNPNAVKLSASNKFDLQMVQTLKVVDRMLAQLQGKSVPEVDPKSAV